MLTEEMRSYIQEHLEDVKQIIRDLFGILKPNGYRQSCAGIR